MLTCSQTYDEQIAVLDKRIEEIKSAKRSNENFQEYMGIHASIWDEEKWLEAKEMRRAAAIE